MAAVVAYERMGVGEGVAIAGQLTYFAGRTAQVELLEVEVATYVQVAVGVAVVHLEAHGIELCARDVDYRSQTVSQREIPFQVGYAGDGRIPFVVAFGGSPGQPAGLSVVGGRGVDTDSEYGFGISRRIGSPDYTLGVFPGVHVVPRESLAVDVDAHDFGVAFAFDSRGLFEESGIFGYLGGVEIPALFAEARQRTTA